MREIESTISSFIERQFPSFYLEEGPLFILFAKEYFKWLEAEDVSVGDQTIPGGTLHHARKIGSYRDIDRTIDEFLVHFKNVYLRGIDFDVITNKRLLVKAAKNLYQSKGTERSFDLLFNLAFGTNISVYYPGDDILKPSDGTWVIPVYLELSRSSKTTGFVGKTVTGSISGATAFVEYLITRNIKGKLVDVAYVSQLKGNFKTGDIITTDGVVQGAPKVIGSLSTIDVTTSGYGFTVGETVDVISARGVEGKARVTEVISETGKVSFAIEDGGWGYSTTANTFVSTKVLKYTNLTNSNTTIDGFDRSETVKQELYRLTCNNFTGNITEGELLLNADSNTATVAYVQHATGANTANLYAHPVNGDIRANNIVYAANQAIIAANNNVVFANGQLLVQYDAGSSTGTTGKITSVSDVTILTINATPSISSNGLHVGSYVKQNTTDAVGYIKAIDRESAFNYTSVKKVIIGSVTGTFNSSYGITTYTDSSLDTPISTATPNNAVTGKMYSLSNVSVSSSRWSSANTVILSGTPTTNATILIASDVGGTFSSNVDISATGMLMGPNTSAATLGIRNISNTFYATGNTRIVGTSSNTYANVNFISTGTGASYSIGLVSDAETVKVATDRINANNDGPGSNTTSFSSMLISGASSGYGNMSSVYIYSGGTGYNNTNIVTFSGGNSGVGSFGAANASIVTDGTGVILSVTLAANVGNSYVTTPSISVVNSTGGSSGVGSGANLTPLFHYGFPKLPVGDGSYLLLDLLNIQTLTVGSIASLTGINPGENYNIDPFVSAYEPGIASLGKYDYLLDIYKAKDDPSIVAGESVEQTITTSGYTITSNTFTGNTGGVYDYSETVYQDNGITNTAIANVQSSSASAPNVTTVVTVQSGTLANSMNVTILTVSSNTNFNPGDTITQGGVTGILHVSNTTTLVVNSVSGTFSTGATPITSTSGGSTTASATSVTYVYGLKGLTSSGMSYVKNVASSSITSSAKGVFNGWTLTSSNTTHNFYIANVSRRSIFTDFYASGVNGMVGVLSGANVYITGVSQQNTLPIGDNAVINGNVVTSTGSVKSIKVVDGGFGYEQDETANLVSSDGTRIATGKLNIINQGVGSGYYSSTRGFLDDNKYIHDGEYYQEFSYEVQSNLPLEKYSEILKKVVHVAGTRLFGKLVLTSSANLSVVDVTSSITIS